MLYQIFPSLTKFREFLTSQLIQNLEKIPKYPSPCSQARKVDEYLYFFLSSFLVLKRHLGFRKYTNLSRNFEPASEEDKISVYYLKPPVPRRKKQTKKAPEQVRGYILKRPKQSKLLYFNFSTCFFQFTSNFISFCSRNAFFDCFWSTVN